MTPMRIRHYSRQYIYPDGDSPDWPTTGRQMTFERAHVARHLNARSPRRACYSFVECSILTYPQTKCAFEIFSFLLRSFLYNLMVEIKIRHDNYAGDFVDERAFRISMQNFTRESAPISSHHDDFKGEQCRSSRSPSPAIYRR